MFRIEHNVETGEITQIELTPEEIAEIENNADANASIEAEKNAQKTALLEKLGITADEAALLLS
ncbi:hypothetical protein UFOVP560_23 [uncultured Caudovirales phage]|uniref:Uncharacterized protein n=1 Tax=uncultured Caudovirales phage TaxID=2100421 RepID=A0A6J5MT53_9CAUD|nr:hypothetical protein UFOVP560_23 [uncultured Caudovirales phage]